MIRMMVVLSFSTTMIIRIINNPVRAFTMVSTRSINSMIILTSSKQAIHYKQYHHSRTSLPIWSMLRIDNTMPFLSNNLKRQRRRYEQQKAQSGTNLHFSTTNCMVPILSSHANNRLTSSSSTCLSSTSQQETEANLSNDKNAKKRIVFLGTPDVAATTLQSLYEASILPNSNYEIVAVVTQPPKRRQRKGSSLELTPVAQITQKFNNITSNIQLLYPEKLSKDDEFINIMEHVIRPDLCITAAYGQYLSKKFLSIPKYGTINIHPSLLPKYRGASPVQRSLEAGETTVGVSVLYTVQKMDAGPIIIQKEVPINSENDTTTNVLPMLFEVGTYLLIDYVLPNILNDTITMTSQNVIQQNELEVSYASMIDSNEAEFKVWKESATTCHNRLRGFSIWPQAYMYFIICCNKDDNETVISSEPIKVKILKTRVVDTNSIQNTDNDNNNEFNTRVTLGPTKNDGLYVTCYDGSILELLIVQPVTKKAFPARDFQNGYPNQIIRWIQNDNNNTDTETT